MLVNTALPKFEVKLRKAAVPICMIPSSSSTSANDVLAAYSGVSV